MNINIAVQLFSHNSNKPFPMDSNTILNYHQINSTATTESMIKQNTGVREALLC